MQESSHEYKVEMVNTTNSPHVYYIHTSNSTCVSSAGGIFGRHYWFTAFLGFMPNLHRDHDKKLDQTPV